MYPARRRCDSNAITERSKPPGTSTYTGTTKTLGIVRLLVRCVRNAVKLPMQILLCMTVFTLIGTVNGRIVGMSPRDQQKFQRDFHRLLTVRDPPYESLPRYLSYCENSPPTNQLAPSF